HGVDFSDGLRRAPREESATGAPARAPSTAPRPWRLVARPWRTCSVCAPVDSPLLCNVGAHDDPYDERPIVTPLRPRAHCGHAVSRLETLCHADGISTHAPGVAGDRRSAWVCRHRLEPGAARGGTGERSTRPYSPDLGRRFSLTRATDRRLGGFRDAMGKKGVVFDVDLLLTPQGVASGGRDTGAEFFGNAEYTLNVDTGKA